ncbi:hypothetical protein [Variimorphobacter saccharofermentans]|jgi:G3E family GTPase|nr:hypothetical protein [Variimorphobacter saccharofermentans]
MREKDINKIPESKNENNDFVMSMEAACSAEFSEGCICCDE